MARLLGWLGIVAGAIRQSPLARNPSTALVIRSEAFGPSELAHQGARLIKKVYGADPLGDGTSQTCESPLRCPRCHKPMKVIAIITDPVQVFKILRHLIKTRKLPTGLDPASLQ